MLNWFKKKPEPSGPDFSHVDSREKAEAMARRGELEAMYLVPLEFGGTENPINVLYVPVGVGEIKAGIDRNVIKPLAAEGKVSNYDAAPQYQGKSFIPNAIKIVASDPGHFTTTIRIWGEGRRS